MRTAEIVGDALASTDAERSILGAILLDNDCFYQAASKLMPAQFYLDSHRKIFTQMIELSTGGSAIDITTLAEALLKRKEVESVGGVAYVASLTDGMPRRENIEHYVAIVADRWRRRQLIASCEKVIEATHDPSNDTEGCYAIAHESLLDLAVGDSGGLTHIREIMPAVIAELERQASQQGLIGFSTGIDAIDHATTGIRPGELWVVGALPGRGKTAIAAQIVLANGKSDQPVAMFSLEMAELELARRFLAAESTISAQKIRNPQYIAREAWSQIGLVAQQLSDWPVWVDPSPSLKIHELIARAQLYIRRFKVRLLVVDYLRLVQAPGGELRERVAYVANALRKLAKQEKVAIVLLSQLRRPEGGINARPTMLDLKESGDIEAHAHVVLLLYMPIGDDGRPTGEEEIIIGKNRNGALGAEPVTFDHGRLQFYPRIPQESMQ